MLIDAATFDALVEMVRSNPEWKSWTMIKELRRRGLEIPQRWVVQKIRSTLRKALKIK
jgi:hypothetical protein